MGSVGDAVIVKQSVACSQQGIDFLQLLFYNAGQGIIEGVRGFSGLKEDVRVLGGTVDSAVLRMRTLLRKASAF